jgi:hypothetical protein
MGLPCLAIASSLLSWCYGVADAPADNPAAVNVDDGRLLHEAMLYGNLGDDRIVITNWQALPAILVT